MQIQIQGVGFYEGNADIGCQIAHDNVRGSLQVSVKQEEYVKALNENNLVELVTKYIAEINKEAVEVQQKKIDDLEKELQELRKEQEEKDKQQAEANLTLMTMISMLEPNTIKDVVNN